MRLFVALEVPDEWRRVANEMSRAIERASGVRLRHVAPGLMHVTLRFLGEVAAEGLEPLDAELRRAVPPVVVTLTLGAVGTFGTPARTAATWLEIGGDLDALHALAVRVEAGVRAAGLPGEERVFSPHLTLARLGRSLGSEERRAVALAVREVEAPPMLPFTAREAVLVQSTLGPGGPRYEVLRRYS